MDSDTAQLPIWIVQGKNWNCEVELDEYNSQFSSVLQAEEAGTRAIEQFKGQDRKIELVLQNGKELELGGVVLVYPKGTNPDDGFLLMVHELLANGAFYPDSIRVEAQTRAVLEQQEKAEQALVNPKQEQEQKPVVEEVKEKKPRKPRKPKDKTKNKPSKKSKPRKKKP